MPPHPGPGPAYALEVPPKAQTSHLPFGQALFTLGAQHLQLALNGPSEGSHLKLKINLNPYLTLYFKINSKWITVSNEESKTIKF